MGQCYKTGDFKKYFKENMNELGLKVPSGLFDSSKKAIETAGLILGTLKLLGKGATMAEVAGATIALEKLAVLSALSASYYVGAVIGSIAVASGRSLGCGYRISDMITLLENNNLKFNNWNSFYMMHPEILDKGHKFRKVYYAKAINVSAGASA